MHAPVPSHTNQGGSLVLGLKSARGTLDGSISHTPSTDPPLSPAVITSSGTGTSTTREVDGSPMDNTNASLDGFLVEDCSDGDDLDEEQLVFSCSEEEYERSPPSSPAPVTSESPLSQSPATTVSPTKPSGVESNPSKIKATGKPHPPSSTNGRWRDLFSSNRNTPICSKLMHFSYYNAIPSCPFLEKDKIILAMIGNSVLWDMCLANFLGIGHLIILLGTHGSVQPHSPYMNRAG